MKEVPDSQSRSQPAPSFEELLSAYHDGELSPQEREAVERQLTNSPAARQQLVEFQRLSGLLHDLPQARLPQEFSRQVLHEAEREMLIPRLRGAVPVERRRPWWWISAGLVASAAAMVAVMLGVRSAPGPEREVAKNSGGGRDIASAPLTVQSEPGARTDASGSSHAYSVRTENAAPAKSEMNMRSREAAGANSDLVAERMEAKAGRGEPSPSVAASAKKLNVPADFDQSRAVKSEEFKTAAAAPGASDRGQKTEFEALRMAEAARQVPGSQAVVVRMVVVDEAAALKVVQVVLDGPDVPANDESKSKRRVSLNSGEKSVNPALGAESQINGLPGVLVEMSNDQLIAVVRKLLKEDPAIQSMQIEEPVELAELSASSTSVPEDQPPAVAAKPTAPVLAEKKSPAADDAVTPKTKNIERGTAAARSPDPGSPISRTIKSPADAASPDSSKEVAKSGDAKSSAPQGDAESKADLPLPRLAAGSRKIAEGNLMKDAVEDKPVTAPVAQFRSRLLKLQPQTWQKRTAGSKNRLPPATLDNAEELKRYVKSSPSLNSPQAQPSHASGLAKAPEAGPVGQTPVHVLFVVEPQPAKGTVEPAGKSPSPGKTGGDRRTKPRYYRQS